MLADIATIIAPIFLIAGIGFIWARQGRPFDTEMVTTLVSNIGVPCLFFSSLTGLDISPGDFGRMAGAFTVATAGFIVVGILVLRAWKLDTGVYLPPLIFGNNGNMGLPLCLFAFGEPGLALAMGPFFVSSIGNVTLGIGLASGDMSPARLFRNPYIYVIVAALAFMTTGTPVPVWLANTTKTVGGLSIPLMLVALGVTLVKLKVHSLGRSVVLSLVRILIGFAIGVAVARLFGFTGVESGILILQCAMPVAVINFLFAARYGRDPEEVAGLIVVSTAISFITLPALLWMVL